MSELGIALDAALRTSVGAAVPLTFAGGLLAGLNPCCVALYPVAAATCCAAPAERMSMTVRRAVAFALGIAIATSIMGLLAALAGRTLRSFGAWPWFVIAIIPIVAGLHLMGVVRLPLSRLQRSRAAQQTGALATGFIAALLLAPCGTPILAAVLSYAAYVGTAAGGTLLLFVYGVGLSLPLLLVGTASGAASARLARSSAMIWVERVSGVALIGMGLYLLWRA